MQNIVKITYDTTRQKQDEMSTYSDRAAEKAEIATEKS